MSGDDREIARLRERLTKILAACEALIADTQRIARQRPGLAAKIAPDEMMAFTVSGTGHGVPWRHWTTMSPFPTRRWKNEQPGEKRKPRLPVS
jgi:hypothetical protein